MDKNNICTVCEIQIEENYCYRCGQSKSNRPTSTRFLFSDFLSNFFSLEKSGFATMLKVLLNPKLIVNNYFFGFKNYYSSPGRILLYGIAFVALHVNFVDKSVFGLSFNVENVGAQYAFWIILFPFLLISSYLTFIRKEKKFSKHIISIIYIATVMCILATVCNDLMVLLFDYNLDFVMLAIFVLVTFLWNSRVFTDDKQYLKLTLSTILQLVIFTGLVICLILVAS